jgi:iron complex outermembrane receptor protein
MLHITQYADSIRAPRGVPSLLGACLALGCMEASHAQPVSERGAASRQLEEIVVTAQKLGEQNLQDVPISIQAVSADTLQRAGASEFVDFAKLAPSINLIDSGNGQYQIYMRGIITGPAATSATQDKPLTSMYIDDVPVSFANFNPNFAMFDVERIEVLRGPQGTLYGAGSMGGNIRIVTTKPDTSRPGAKIEASGATTRDGDESYGLKGLVNFPVVADQLGMRLTATHEFDAGFVDNVLIPAENGDDLTRDSARLSALWLPTDALEVTANVMWQDMDSDDRTRRMVPGTQTLYDNVTGEGEFTVVQTLHDPFVDEQILSNLSLDLNLGWARLFSSTSYFDREFTNYQQGFFAEFFDKLINGDIAVEGWVIDDWNVNNFVQELRLSSPTDRRLKWVVGAFYTDEFARFVDDYPVENFEERTGIPTDIWGAPKNNLFKGNTENRQEQLALFGEFTYAFTDRLDATLGLRWFKWEQDFHQFFSGFFNGGVTIKDESVDVDEVTPKFSVAYHITDDAMIYATAAKGYRLGGVNDPVPPDLCADELAELGLTEAPSTFDPDSLWNYEIGLKSTWLDRRLTVNTTVYYLDWSDIQTRNTLETCGFFFTENVGEAESTGVEMEVLAVPVQGLTTTLAVAYTNAELAEDVPNLNAQKGDKAPFVPEFSISGAVDYQRSLTEQLDGYVRLDVQYVDDRTTSYGGSVEMPSYVLGNLHLGVQQGDGRWTVETFVTNLWDENAIHTHSGASAFGVGAREVIERPRTIGLLFRWNY